MHISKKSCYIDFLLLVLTKRKIQNDITKKVSMMFKAFTELLYAPKLNFQ